MNPGQALFFVGLGLAVGFFLTMVGLTANRDMDVKRGWMTVGSSVFLIVPAKVVIGHDR